MMRFIKLSTFLIAIGILVTGFTTSKTLPVKCMLQLTNYTGEGAYVIVSLMNPKGEYEQTIYVQGTDPEWYSEMLDWWKHIGKKETDIDAISGETISGGERTVRVLQIPTDKIDKGYSLRFETAVENMKYYKADVEFPLTSENLKGKHDGTGYIRYVRMLSK